MDKIDERERLIYDLRRFADNSPYLAEISKIGANEIINFLDKKINESILCDFCKKLDTKKAHCTACGTGLAV